MTSAVDYYLYLTWWRHVASSVSINTCTIKIKLIMIGNREIKFIFAASISRPFTAITELKETKRFNSTYQCNWLLASSWSCVPKLRFSNISAYRDLIQRFSSIVTIITTSYCWNPRAYLFLKHLFFAQLASLSTFN